MATERAVKAGTKVPAGMHAQQPWYLCGCCMLQPSLYIRGQCSLLACLQQQGDWVKEKVSTACTDILPLASLEATSGCTCADEERAWFLSLSEGLTLSTCCLWPYTASAASCGSPSLELLKEFASKRDVLLSSRALGETALRCLQRQGESRCQRSFQSSHVCSAAQRAPLQTGAL